MSWSKGFDPTTVQPNERVWRWWDAGIEMDIQPLTVVRVSPKTVLVRTDQGSTFRLPFRAIEGRVDWPEE